MKEPMAWQTGGSRGFKLALKPRGAGNLVTIARMRVTTPGGRGLRGTQALEAIDRSRR